MEPIEYTSPAKINLMLSVHGQRGDGFHDLTSLVVGLQFGDRLRVCIVDGVRDELLCDDPRVPVGADNLISKAAVLFREATARNLFFRFELDKQIPMGAGLGGGSSNASAALLAMNQLSGAGLNDSQLRELAAQLGSDCAFFIDPKPSVMSGRGEQIDVKTGEAYRALSGRTVVLFRPDFAVNTGWAYSRLIAAKPHAYSCEAAAHESLAAFEASGELSPILLNSFEPVIGAKYVAIPSLLGLLRDTGIDCLMSGSGSCCFALPKNDGELNVVRELCTSAFGDEIFFIETFLL